MSTPLKRANRSISPPPLRRKFRPPDPGVDHMDSSHPSQPCHHPHPICIFSWNVNGVGLLLQRRLTFHPSASQTLSPLRLFLQRHQWPQMLCLQEVKIANNDIPTQRSLQSAANHGALSNQHTYTAFFSLPTDKHNATGFGGKVHGVATLIRDDTVSTVGMTWTPPWSLEGRLLIHDMTNGIVVINGYWVNGTSNPYRNPTSGAIQGTRHDYKLEFHRRLLEHIVHFQTLNKHVVLVGDMNIARSRLDGHPNLRTTPVQHLKNRADFNDKFFHSEAGMRGVDVFRHIKGEQRKYTYHPRGRVWGESCDRVDLIIVSHSMIDAVVDTDICDSAAERGHSDHVPLWVSIDPSKIKTSKPPKQAAVVEQAEE